MEVRSEFTIFPVGFWKKGILFILLYRPVTMRWALINAFMILLPANMTRIFRGGCPVAKAYPEYGLSAMR